MRHLRNTLVLTKPCTSLARQHLILLFKIETDTSQLLRLWMTVHKLGLEVKRYKSILYNRVYVPSMWQQSPGWGQMFWRAGGRSWPHVFWRAGGPLLLKPVVFQNNNFYNKKKCCFSCNYPGLFIDLDITFLNLFLFITGISVKHSQ